MLLWVNLEAMPKVTSGDKNTWVNGNKGYYPLMNGVM